MIGRGCKRSYLLVLCLAVVAVALMSTFEILKDLAFPSITAWQSHGLTRYVFISGAMTGCRFERR